jgi:hypothetical protein
MPRGAMFASLAALVALALAPAPAPARTPLKVVRATKPPTQVKVGSRVTIRVKIRNQSRRGDYVYAGLALRPASPLPLSSKESDAYGSRDVPAGHGPRSALKPGQSGKAKLVWKVPKVHRGFRGKLVACAQGKFTAKPGQCRAIGRIRVKGSLLSLRAGVSATSSFTDQRTSIGLAAQELASDGRGFWWAGPERWTAATTIDQVPGRCPTTVLDSRVVDKPLGAGLSVKVGNYGAALRPSNLYVGLEVPTVRVTSQTGGRCAEEGDTPDVTDYRHEKFFQPRLNRSGRAQFSSMESGEGELHGTLTVQP